MLRFSKRHFAIALALVTFSIAAIPALAHARPRGMTPLPNSTIASPPNITITFTEAIEPKFSSLAVTDEKGKTFNREQSHIVAGDATSLTLILPPLSAGVYVVHWVSVAADGHRSQGAYNFTVK